MGLWTRRRRRTNFRLRFASGRFEWCGPARQGQSAVPGAAPECAVGVGFAENGFPEAMGSYRRNMVRLADKAVRDYMDARRYVLAQIQEMQRTPEEMAHGRVIYAHLT